MPGRAFPPVGPLGLSSPRSRSVHSHRPAVLCLAKTAGCPSRVASLVARSPIPCLLPTFVFLAARRAGEAPPQRQGSWSAGTPTLPAFLTRRQTALSSSRVTPLSACPALRPRWCPEHLAPCLRDCCLPGAANRRLSRSASASGYPHGPQLYSFRGSIPRPAPSLHPAPYLPLRERTRVRY
jgi:hypothetical protein